MDIPQGSVIQAISTVDPGLNQTVSVYQWTLDVTVLPVNTANITIYTYNLSLGEHTLLLSAQNSCGNWGSFSELFNIIPPTSYTEWIASMGGIGAIEGNLIAVGIIIDGYLYQNLGFTVTLGNVGTTIDYYLGLP